MDRFTSPGVARVRRVAQRGMLKPLVWRLVRVTTKGEEDIKDLEAPFIVVANHSSHLDAPLVIGALPYRLARYLAAGAAADYFFDVQWRKWLTTLFFNAFAIERNSEGKRGGSSKALLERKVPLLIFPEGGRSKTGVMGKFKPGDAPRGELAQARALPRDGSVWRADAGGSRRNGREFLDPTCGGSPQTARNRVANAGALSEGNCT